MSIQPHRPRWRENLAAPIQPRLNGSGGHAVGDRDPPPRRSRHHTGRVHHGPRREDCRRAIGPTRSAVLPAADGGSAVSTTIARRWRIPTLRPAALSHAKACRSAGTTWPGSSGRTGLNRSRPPLRQDRQPTSRRPIRSEPRRKPQEGLEMLAGIFPAPNRFVALSDALAGLWTVLKAEARCRSARRADRRRHPDLDHRHGNRPGRSGSRSAEIRRLAPCRRPWLRFPKPQPQNLDLWAI